jgi:hypothetical protein
MEWLLNQHVYYLTSFPQSPRSSKSDSSDSGGASIWKLGIPIRKNFIVNKIFAWRRLPPDEPVPSSVHTMLKKCSNSHMWNVISFPTSTRGSKMELGVKSYDRNTKSSKMVRQDEPLVFGLSAFIRCSKVDWMVRIFLKSSIEFHKLSNKYKIIKNRVRSKEIWVKYRKTYGNVGWSDATKKMGPSVYLMIHLN